MEAVSRRFVHQGLKLFLVKNICSFLCIIYLNKFQNLSFSPSQNFLCKLTGSHTILVLVSKLLFTFCPELTLARNFPTYSINITSGHSRSILQGSQIVTYCFRSLSSSGYPENCLDFLHPSIRCRKELTT